MYGWVCGTIFSQPACGFSIAAWTRKNSVMTPSTASVTVRLP
jgi:hypothetical protein